MKSSLRDECDLESQYKSKIMNKFLYLKPETIVCLIS